MLPQTSPDDVVPPTRTIYINPNFQKRNISTTSIATKEAVPHINPLFLQAHRAPAIHMNPNFLQKKILEQQLLQQQQQQQLQLLLKQQEEEKKIQAVGSPVLKAPLPANGPCKIISKSRMRIVREPVLQQTNANKAASANADTIVQKLPLIRLTKRKLVRRAVVDTKAVSAKIGKTVKINGDSFDVLPTSVGKYKIDNRRAQHTISNSNASPLLKLRRRRSFVARFALRRTAEQATTIKHKTIASASTLKTTSFKPNPSLPANKKLQLLNINGVLYKSTRNKLQRKEAIINSTGTTKSTDHALKTKTKTSAIAKSPHERTLFVRGTKFIMDSKGFKLTRVAAPSSNNTVALASRQRIDIGGLTYIASGKTQNVFVRTRNHLALAHLNNAKQRSLHQLTRRLVKSNVPCAIYQRLGKCAAFERGKCSKVHNKLQVTICSRFLRGECHNANCLLSHSVSLSKMPVCRFYLQGVCVRTDCPYLHKKLSANAKICDDFLRGFCHLAEQCNKRHEFLCPTFERNGKCEILNCAYCKSVKNHQHWRAQTTEKQKRTLAVEVQQKKKKQSLLEEAGATDKVQLVATSRYFNGNEEMRTTEERSDSPMHVDSTLKDNDDDNTTAEDDASQAAAATSRPRRRPSIGLLPAFIPLS